MVFSFLCSFSCLMVFHLFALVNVVVNQKASTEADVMSKIDGVLKHAPDNIDARDRRKICHKRDWIL